MIAVAIVFTVLAVICSMLALFAAPGSDCAMNEYEDGGIARTFASASFVFWLLAIASYFLRSIP